METYSIAVSTILSISEMKLFGIKLPLLLTLSLLAAGVFLKWRASVIDRRIRALEVEINTIINDVLDVAHDEA